jgi:hypothetical protein
MSVRWWAWSAGVLWIAGCAIAEMPGSEPGTGPDAPATKDEQAVQSNGPAEAGAEAAVNVAATPKPETCNGLDDNLDGTIDESGCSDPVGQFSGHAYMSVKAEKTWSSARAHCASFGYHLVTINGVPENDFVQKIASKLEGGPRVWIGFNDRATEGTFVWDESSSSTFINWASGQPDNFLDEDCTVLDPHTSTGSWDDIDCEDSRSFVCEAGP